jgi:hypothetical protein
MHEDLTAGMSACRLDSEGVPPAAVFPCGSGASAVFPCTTRPDSKHEREIDLFNAISVGEAFTVLRLLRDEGVDPNAKPRGISGPLEHFGEVMLRYPLDGPLELFAGTAVEFSLIAGQVYDHFSPPNPAIVSMLMYFGGNPACNGFNGVLLMHSGGLSTVEFFPVGGGVVPSFDGWRLLLGPKDRSAHNFWPLHAMIDVYEKRPDHASLWDWFVHNADEVAASLPIAPHALLELQTAVHQTSCAVAALAHQAVPDLDLAIKTQLLDNAIVGSFEAVADCTSVAYLPLQWFLAAADANDPPIFCGHEPGYIELTTDLES